MINKICLLKIINNQKRFNLLNFSNSSWHRVDYKDLTVFFHAEQLPKKDNPSHRHCDLTSFVLYWKGQPILIDTGRFNYIIDDSLGNYGVSARAHNSLTINTLEPQAGVNTTRLPGFYRSSKVNTRNNNDNDEFKFELEHNGFRRLFGDAIMHTRAFSISDGIFTMEDRIDGKKNHHIDTYFHWSPEIKVIKNEDNSSFFIESSDNQRFKGLFSYNHMQKNDRILKQDLVKTRINANGTGWYSPIYGLKQKTTTLNFFQEVKLPVINRYSLEWEV